MINIVSSHYIQISYLWINLLAKIYLCFPRTVNRVHSQTFVYLGKIAKQLSHPMHKFLVEVEQDMFWVLFKLFYYKAMSFVCVWLIYCCSFLPIFLCFYWWFFPKRASKYNAKMLSLTTSRLWCVLQYIHTCSDKHNLKNYFNESSTGESCKHEIPTNSVMTDLKGLPLTSFKKIVKYNSFQRLHEIYAYCLMNDRLNICAIPIFRKTAKSP